MTDSTAESFKSPSVLEASQDGSTSLDRFAGIDHKKLLRKVDWHLLPYIIVSYMVVRLDLNNINNAGTMNKETGDSIKQVLHLDAKQWAWVVGCFYYPYMVSEPICTFLLRPVTPSRWLCRIMVSWGAVMCFMSLVKNYGGLIACRVLLGLFEGSFFTSVILSWSYWYHPSELAPRILWLYVANSSSGGFSGIFAYAVSFGNSSKIYGWQILFILEGLITVVLGIGMLFLLPNFPTTSKWLTPLEQEYIVAHLHRDAPKLTSKNFDWPECRRMLLDPTFYSFTLFWMCWSVSAWGVTTMQTFLILDLGITSSAGTQLMQIPPAATGIAFCIISAYLIRKRNVSAFLVTLLLVGGAFIAFIVLLKASQAGVRFAAVCVIVGAAPSAYACLWARRVASLRGASASALGIGLLNAVSQFSGILGPQVFRTDYAPRYHNSIIASLVFCAIGFLTVGVSWYLMEGDLSWSPLLKRHVLAQTQLIEGDVDAAQQGETVATEKLDK
ncbi:uncharacterized protein JCM15063_002643 [Sporobolomyces koalae]|uniref:uncharacterized protein n=1 Tax=Sporobolomyces koalae TaxID=500713 RepID=UPI00317400F4